MVQPLGQWYSKVKQAAGPILVSGLLSAVLTATSILSKNLWPEFVRSIFAASEWLLQLFQDNVISIPEKYYLGIEEFVVHVASACSGVEGMGLAVGFTILYLYLFRDHLYFPRSLILIPVAALMSWMFNVIRIASLILLGKYISAEFAVDGFHSQAGWFFFIILVLTIIYLFHKMNWFKKQIEESHEALSLREDLLSAILICFIVFLFGSLIAGFDQVHLNWLYPVKVIAGLLVLYYFWSTLQIPKPDKILESTLFGALACILWVWLIPVDEGYNSDMQAALGDSSVLSRILCISTRNLGS